MLFRSYRTFAYPFTPLFFIGGNLWIVFYTVTSRPLVGLCGLATLALGLLLYGLMRGSLTRQRAALADGSLVAGAED